MSRGVIGWSLVAVQGLLLLALILLPWRAPTTASLVVGGALGLAGGVLAVVAMRRLGAALTPTPVPIKGAGLRTDGAYRYVRHPIYTAVLLIVFGCVVAIGTVWSLACALLLLVFFVVKSRWEDGLLAEEYGPAWTAWSRTTGALTPRLRPRR